jgi:thiamine biosynthesis lipoprotein
VNWRGLRLDAAAGTAYLERRGARLDLGGIAKLYILDAGLRVLTALGVEHALINGGGDVAVRGTTQGRPWRIGIRDPRAPQQLLGVVEATSGFVVSSGDYERYFMRDGKRYHHILDPRTGYPARGPRHVTLVADRLELVNGYGTAIMVLGADAGKEHIAGTPGLEALIVDNDGTLWLSPNLTRRFHRASGAHTAAAAGAAAAPGDGSPHSR